MIERGGRGLTTMGGGGVHFMALKRCGVIFPVFHPFSLPESDFSFFCSLFTSLQSLGMNITHYYVRYIRIGTRKRAERVLFFFFAC